MKNSTCTMNICVKNYLNIKTEITGSTNIQL